MTQPPETIWVEFDASEDFSNPPVWEGMIWHAMIDHTCTEYVTATSRDAAVAAAEKRGWDRAVKAAAEAIEPHPKATTSIGGALYIGQQAIRALQYQEKDDA